MRHRWGCISLATLASIAVLGFLAFFAQVI